MNIPTWVIVCFSVERALVVFALKLWTMFTKKQPLVIIIALIGLVAALSSAIYSIQSKKISNDQELIQSDPISCPQNQKGNN